MRRAASELLLYHALQLLSLEDKTLQKRSLEFGNCTDLLIYIQNHSLFSDFTWLKVHMTLNNRGLNCMGLLISINIINVFFLIYDLFSNIFFIAAYFIVRT